MNDMSQENGQALILKSIARAKLAVRHMMEGWITRRTSSSSWAFSPHHQVMVEHVLVAILLHDAVKAGRISPSDPHRVLCFGEE